MICLLLFLICTLFLNILSILYTGNCCRIEGTGGLLVSTLLCPKSNKWVQTTLFPVHSFLVLVVQLKWCMLQNLKENSPQRLQHVASAKQAP